MSTFKDLQTELDRLAEQAPSDSDIRQALTERSAAHGKRRRTTALIAVAASVVLVAGGASVAAAVFSQRADGPAAPSPVVQVPDVPLPADTQLIRHQLQPVETPVTATPPKGMTGQLWFSVPGKLTVSWSNPSAGSDGMFGQGETSGSAGPGADGALAEDPGSVGYIITDSRDGALTSVGPDGSEGPATPTVSHRDMTLGDRSVTVDTAPSGTVDEFGHPADERISWQLSDGRWIHVRSDTDADTKDGESSPSSGLKSFAKTITETPQTLYRSMGIGLTLPGLTTDSSMSSTYPTALGGSLFLCPDGVDPMALNYSSSTGSGSADPDGTSTSTETDTFHDNMGKCIMAVVANSDVFTRGAGRTIAVGDTVAHVSAESGSTLGSAWAKLPDGFIATATAPQSANLSDDDLAALVASVRLSPDVTAAQGDGS